MAVTGVFNADFASFYTAVTKADAQLQTLTSTTAKTNTATQSVSKMYQQFDGVLQSAGVNLQPYVKGLEDIASMSGKTATSLGALGTAGAIAGAALVGWKIGTFIDELTGASKAVEAMTNAVTGWGAALATQELGAKMDVLARASGIAKREITDFAEAQKIIAAEVQKNIVNQTDWAAKLAGAQREVRGLSEAQRDGIAVMQQAGATTEQITAKYGVSALALKELAKSEDLNAEARKKATKAAEERAAAEAKLNAEYAKLMSETKNANQLAIMDAEAAKMTKAKSDAAAGWFNELQKTIKATNDATAAEKARIDQNQAEIDGILAQGAAHTQAGAAAAAGADQTVQGYQQIAQQVTITGEAVKEWINLMEYTAKANAILQGGSSLFTTRSERERVAQIGTGAALPTGFQMGGGGSQTINNSFNLVDTESNLARKVSDEIMRTVRAGTQLGTA